jgi:hypothetical protein
VQLHCFWFKIQQIFMGEGPFQKTSETCPIFPEFPFQASMVASPFYREDTFQQKTGGVPAHSAGSTTRSAIE